jgi:CheY-like chemotaxis protein
MKKAILCVDDELIILYTLKEELDSYFGDEFVYETASNTDEAFEIINDLTENSIDLVLILSDWLMPFMKGDEFLIKVHEMHPHIKTIMITGQADDAAIEKARKIGGLVECVRKPWDSEQLFKLIRSCVHQVEDQ